jgi:hypothetical protein
MIRSRPFDSGARVSWLCACVAVHSGAAVTSQPCDKVVTACLADGPGRMTTFGGRDGLACSLASVYACLVTLFLGGWRRCISYDVSDDMKYKCAHVAVSSDGSTLVVARGERLLQYDVDSAALLRIVGGFFSVTALYIAEDDFVFIADPEFDNSCFKVLTPALEHVATKQRDDRHPLPPVALCACSEFVVVATTTHLTLFRRSDLARMWTFGETIREYFGISMSILRDGDGALVAIPTGSMLSVFRLDMRDSGFGLIYQERRARERQYVEHVAIIAPDEFVEGSPLGAWFTLSDSRIKICAGEVDGIAVHRDTLFVATGTRIEILQ